MVGTDKVFSSEMMVKGNFTSLLVLNKEIKVRLGWNVSPPTNQVISCKKLRDEGLHTLLDMMGYCNDEELFEFVQHDVLMEDMNDGKMEYVKFWEGGFEQLCASLT